MTTEAPKLMPCPIVNPEGDWAKGYSAGWHDAQKNTRPSSDVVLKRGDVETAIQGIEYCLEKLNIEADAGRYPVSMISTEGGQGWGPIQKALDILTAATEKG